MNIAGPKKDSPLIRRGFQAGCRKLTASLKESHAEIVEHRTYFETIGYKAYCVVRTNLETLKQLCTKIQEFSPLGWLFDMDVLDQQALKSDGKK